jgi:hypothetical protein
MMTQLVLQSTATAQWHDLVNEAQQTIHCQLNETLESYLVFLLERFSRRPEMLSRILARDYLEASARGGQQHEQLRDIGDHCLLFSGLFPLLAERRLVRVSYFVSLGRSAYHRIAASGHNINDLYAGLSRGFVQLMDILHAIRGLSDEHNKRMLPLQAYELWQDTGSQQAYQLVCAISGAIPGQPTEALDQPLSPLH